MAKQDVRPLFFGEVFDTLIRLRINGRDESINPTEQELQLCKSAKKTSIKLVQSQLCYILFN